MKWQFFYLYVLLDIFSRYVVGWLVAGAENAGLAQTPLFDARALLRSAGNRWIIRHPQTGDGLSWPSARPSCLPPGPTTQAD